MLGRVRSVSAARTRAAHWDQAAAIARLEAAKSNVGLDTIQAIAIALDAGIAISLRPAEGEAG